MRSSYVYIAVLILTCCISAFSQVLLKKASLREYSSFIRQYLNPYVITGYSLFFVVLAVNIYVLRFIPVSICSAFSESLPLVLSFATGKIFFGEKLTKRMLIGAVLIVTGILIIVF